MNFKLMLGLALLNGVLALGLVTGSQDGPLLPFGIVDCCRNAGTPSGYCCQNCCWITPDCETDQDCKDA